jgi:hypothetical protein
MVERLMNGVLERTWEKINSDLLKSNFLTEALFWLAGMKAVISHPKLLVKRQECLTLHIV